MINTNANKWVEVDHHLVRNFKFKSFAEAILFMNEVATICTELDHHPWWSNEYHQVTIKLCTHDQGSIITEKDLILANRIDTVIEKYIK